VASSPTSSATVWRAASDVCPTPLSAINGHESDRLLLSRDALLNLALVIVVLSFELE
jgi:hypothetical protein